MKRAALCVLCALLLLPGLAQAGSKKKNLPITLDFFESLSYAVTPEDFKEKIQGMGGRVQRDGYVFGFALNGMPIKRIEPSFFQREPGLICVYMEFEPRPSSTYMEPGPNYDAILEMLLERYGEDYTENRRVFGHYKYWQTDEMSVELNYNSKRRERRASIMLLFAYENPRSPDAGAAPEPPPATPALFVFPGGARMGMTWDEVKALYAVKPRKEKGEVLAYQTKLFDMDALITYTFDSSLDVKACLISIAVKFTKTPYDPAYYVSDFEQVSDACTYQHYGMPAEEQPMIWAEDHPFDPRDGSKWVEAVKKGALAYRHTWVAGDVIVTHKLTGEKGSVYHTLLCELDAVR